MWCSMFSFIAQKPTEITSVLYAHINIIRSPCICRAAFIFMQKQLYVIISDNKTGHILVADSVGHLFGKERAINKLRDKPRRAS